MISNKIADKITKISISSTQNSFGTVRNETENNKYDKEIPKGRNVSPEKI